MQIIDSGISRDSFVIKDLDYDPNDIDNLPESGMGLYLIKQLMDDLDYYSINGKNYFTLRKFLY
jgi:serine/threonine-protein kinase RsbW